MLRPDRSAALRRRRPLRRVALLAAAVLGGPLAVSAVPAHAASGISGVVNTYQAVSAIGGTTVTLAGNRRGADATFAAGDRVMVVQMTGANPAAVRGSSLGNYEVATVQSVSGTSLTLTRPLARSYAPSTEKVQLVRIPGRGGATTVASTVTAAGWDGSTGGVVALSGSTLNLAGKTIDVRGDGFTNTATATGSAAAGNTVGAGSTTGRGFSGSNRGGAGGGGLGGAGGAGGNGSGTNAGGSVAGGLNPGGGTADGTDGGVGAPNSLGRIGGGGAGGGGGVIGGGGGGGGGDLALLAPGGGGGVAGGGGGGQGSLVGTARSGAGGGGVGGVGTGGDGLAGGSSLLQQFGTAGGGGGSYGGGGGAGSIQNGTSQAGGGGGGGGSYTGGGDGGGGNGTQSSYEGGDGNRAVSGSVPGSAQYLNAGNPRLMLGGAGGRGSSESGSTNGGAGGGVVVLDFDSISGGGAVDADGADGITPSTGVHSGSGGGGGGQVKVTSRAAVSGLAVSADGGTGGKPSSALVLGAGAGGAGGGGGGVWLELAGAGAACGTSSAAGVGISVTGGTSPRITNLLGLKPTVSGGAGGRGLVCSSPAPAYTIGNRVFRDADADGVQDSADPGLGGVAVTLIDESGTSVAATTTNGTGYYSFGNLRPAGYQVQFGLPSNCAYTIPDATADGDDSDADPRTGRTSLINLTGDTDDVDAGLVCSTSSATAVGGYYRGPLTDLLPAAAGPFDGASATAVMSQTGPTTSSFILQVSGIDPSVAGMTYGSHLHFATCVPGNGAAAGPHYNTDLLAGVMPPRTNPTTEVWLDFTVGPDGYAISHTSVPFVPSAAERAIVIHEMMTNPDTGAAGARVACLPFVIR